MALRPISNPVAQFLADPHRLLIGGAWVPGAGRVIDVENPATEQVIARVASASLTQVDDAVAAARAAMRGAWGRKNARDRAALLLRFADLIERDAEIIAQIMTLDMGQGLRSSRAVAQFLSAPLFRYYAGWADKIVGESFDPIVGMDSFEFMAATRLEPIGVVAAIIPWNAPPGMMGLKLAPALAVGCAVVLKTAELAPLCGAYYAKLWHEAGGPPGSLNVLHGFGEDVGAALSAHGDVDKITFTGSTAVGKAIATAATGNLKRVTLELGGKSPFIVFPDVDIDEVAQAAASWCFVASGQACVAATRIFVHDDIHNAFVEKMRAATLSMRLGDGMDESTDLGPLISRRQKQRVQAYIEVGVAEGATMTCGTEAVPAAGHFVRPVIFTNVTPMMKIAREEIFGPVMCVFRFSDEAKMLETVNDTPFALSGSVWTRELQRALRVARRIDAGQIGVNVHAPMSVQTPFGGNKQSGWGREFGRAGLEPFLKTKAITIRVGARSAPGSGDAQ